MQNMLSSFFGWYKFFNFIRKENHTNFIVILNGRKCKRSSHFGNNIFLQLQYSTKFTATRNINQQTYRQFALFFKNLYIRMSETSSHIPVNRPDIIAVLIFTHFGKGHTTTFKSRMVFACKDILRQTASLYLNFSYFLY